MSDFSIDCLMPRLPALCTVLTNLYQLSLKYNNSSLNSPTNHQAIPTLQYLLMIDPCSSRASQGCSSQPAPCLSL